jgi:hypothetical protein
MALWDGYRHKFDYAADISWDAVITAVKKLAKMAI